MWPQTQMGRKHFYKIEADVFFLKKKHIDNAT